MDIFAPDERLPSSATLMKSMNPVKPEDLMDPVSVVDVKHHVIVEPMDPKDLFENVIHVINHMDYEELLNLKGVNRWKLFIGNSSSPMSREFLDLFFHWECSRWWCWCMLNHFHTTTAATCAPHPSIQAATVIVSHPLKKRIPTFELATLCDNHEYSNS